MSNITELEFNHYGTLQIVNYIGKLFRADREYYEKRTLGNEARSPRTFFKSSILNPLLYTNASNMYTDRNIKYFSTSRDEVLSYASRGAPFINTFSTIEPLKLLNMKDPETRKTLLNYFSANGKENVKKAIEIAFPEEEGQIYRYSSEDTQVSANDTSLRSICSLENIDGYFTPKEEQHKTYKFHSEIGLCQKAFNKLKLESTEQSKLSSKNQVGRHHSVGVHPQIQMQRSRLITTNQTHKSNETRSNKNTKQTGKKRSRINFQINFFSNNNNMASPPNIKRVKKERKTRKNYSRKLRTFKH